MRVLACDAMQLKSFQFKALSICIFTYYYISTLSNPFSQYGVLAFVNLTISMAQQAAPSEIRGFAVDESYQDEAITGTAMLQIQKRYGEERAKRLKPDGDSQYIDVTTSEQFKEHYIRDPWLSLEQSTVESAQRFGNSKCKALILGAGFGGLLHAVMLIEAGMDASDIRLVDTAGGFGGTWYWNRYPGLMCDVESYIYMPLLEETGYMPKNKYAYGPELLEYCNLIADKWKLRTGLFSRRKLKKRRGTKPTRNGS